MTMSDHFRRAARFDTLELEERLHRADVEGRAARAAIEAELRREYWGLSPTSWKSGPRERD